MSGGNQHDDLTRAAEEVADRLIGLVGQAQAVLKREAEVQRAERAAAKRRQRAAAKKKTTGGASR